MNFLVLMMSNFRRRSCGCLIIIPSRFIWLGFWNIFIPRFKFYNFIFFIFLSNHIKIIFFLPIKLIGLMRIWFIKLIRFYSWINPPLVMIDFSFCRNSVIIFSHGIAPSPSCFKFSCSHFDLLKFFCFNSH